MQLRVIENGKIKKLNDVKVGDLLLCEGGVYFPVKSIMIVSCYPMYYRASNNITFHMSTRTKIRTTDGFKIPELWDNIFVTEELTPTITTCTLLDRIMFFHDILIDGNLQSPEGIVFKYSD
jgi:hypothetical protein